MKWTNNPKIDTFRLWYTDEATLVGTHKLPLLTKQHLVPSNIRSWSERSHIKDLSKHWIDFFIDDYRFEGLWNAFVHCIRLDDPTIENFWRRMDSYMSVLHRAAGVISTDYSMLPEMLPDQRNWNCAKNRITAYYLEKSGVPTIPVATWCSADDFDWCFDGLPEDSTIAISTNGCLSTPQGVKTLFEGAAELERQKQPWLVVICGREVEGLGEVFQQHMYYPSFSQRMQVRTKECERSGR